LDRREIVAVRLDLFGSVGAGFCGLKFLAGADIIITREVGEVIATGSRREVVGVMKPLPFAAVNAADGASPFPGAASARRQGGAAMNAKWKS
jgi:hypothetical protein